MSTEQNKAVIQRLFSEFWNQKNVAVIDELFAPDFVAHRSGRPVLQGATSMKPMVEGVTRTFGDDCYSTIDALIAEDDHVVARWTLRGAQRGEWRGIAPTGKPVTITGITIHRIANGKIAELWAEEDWLGLMQQIGGLPASS
jgi:predicted ester cyclase